MEATSIDVAKGSPNAGTLNSANGEQDERFN